MTTHTDCNSTTEINQCNTECDSDVGMTVGLIDSVIFMCRVLAPRLRMTCGDQEDPAIVEALRDLSQDRAVQWVWDHRPYTQDEKQDAILDERLTLLKKKERTTKEESRLQKLHRAVEEMKFLPKAGESRFHEKFNDIVRNFIKDLPVVPVE